ncbi:MAG: hypothetical protein ACXW6K_12525 [Candidatus Binatia bacterium]
MLIEEFLVGHERGNKDPVLQRQIAGDMGNHRFDYACFAPESVAGLVRKTHRTARYAELAAHKLATAAIKEMIGETTEERLAEFCMISFLI